MTQREDATRIRKAAEHTTRTWFCQSGKHDVSTTIAPLKHRGRRICPNCKARITALRNMASQ